MNLKKNWKDIYE